MVQSQEDSWLRGCEKVKPKEVSMCEFLKKNSSKWLKNISPKNWLLLLSLLYFGVELLLLLSLLLWQISCFLLFKMVNQPLLLFLFFSFHLNLKTFFALVLIFKMSVPFFHSHTVMPCRKVGCFWYCLKKRMYIIEIQSTSKHLEKICVRSIALFYFYY